MTKSKMIKNTNEIRRKTGREGFFIQIVLTTTFTYNIQQIEIHYEMVSKPQRSSQ